MFAQHVSRQLSAYINEELSAETRERVAQHLISCANCRMKFEEVRFGSRMAAQIQLIEASDLLWPAIIARINAPVVTQSRPIFLKPLAIAAALMLVAAAAFVWLRPNANRGSEWNVARLGGAPRIDSRRMSDSGRIAVGQWLETDATSRAKIDVATIGNVEIDPNSRVRLLSTSSDEHRLELERGRLSAHISAPPRLFFVDTPSGVAEDLGCAYTLEVNDLGDSILHVTLGWVSLQLIDRESSVPAGAACEMKKGYGPGTPYFEDATPPFKQALSRFDFPVTRDEPGAALATILSEARSRDAMTLWYLLTRVDPNDRASVYDRMAALVDPPQDVTREGVLNLNVAMLNRWKDKLAIRSDSQEKKVHSFWRHLWTHTLGRIHDLEEKQ